jgi:predicted phosphoribosyltransferase
MASVYFSSRAQAGIEAVQHLVDSVKSKPSTVVSLSTDAVMVALQVANYFQCPLQLYLSDTIVLPGQVEIGGVNQEGGFSYSSDMEGGFQDYFYQEYHGYLEDAKRESFSSLNRELKSRDVIRKDLLSKRVIMVVADCLESPAPLDSFLDFAKSVSFDRIVVCAPIAMAKDLSHIEKVSDSYYIAGKLDFFFGADHYFTDNTVIPRETAIDSISKALKLWP